MAVGAGGALLARTETGLRFTAANLHLAFAAVIVTTVVCEPPRDRQKLGSVELDIDIVQPRLAPPRASHSGGDDANKQRPRLS